MGNRLTQALRTAQIRTLSCRRRVFTDAAGPLGTSTRNRVDVSQQHDVEQHTLALSLCEDNTILTFSYYRKFNLLTDVFKKKKTQNTKTKKTKRKTRIKKKKRRRTNVMMS